MHIINSKVKYMKYLFFLFSILLLAGCIPKGGSYYKFHSKSDSEYFRTSCYGQDGAPSILFFKYHDIYLSIRILDYKDKILLGIHIPKNNTVQIMNKHMIFSKGNNEETKQLKLIAMEHYPSGSSAPYVFRSDDPYGKENFFNTLSGNTNIITFKLIGSDKIAYKWYQFYANFEKIENGTIKVPNMKINGKLYEGPSLRFEKDNYFQLLGAFNC